MRPQLVGACLDGIALTLGGSLRGPAMRLGSVQATRTTFTRQMDALRADEREAIRIDRP